MSQVFCSRLSKHDWPEFCVDPNHPNEDDWRAMVTWRAALRRCSREPEWLQCPCGTCWVEPPKTQFGDERCPGCSAFGGYAWALLEIDGCDESELDGFMVSREVEAGVVSDAFREKLRALT